MFSKGNRTLGAPAPTLVTNTAVPSIIAADMTVVGDIKTVGEVQVDGTVNGDVEAKDITVGATASVRGELIADSIRVCGAVYGLIRAREVVLLKTARVEGDIFHDVLSIEAGAHVDGGCRRLNAASETAGPKAITGTVWEPASRQGLDAEV